MIGLVFELVGWLAGGLDEFRVRALVALLRLAYLEGRAEALCEAARALGDAGYSGAHSALQRVCNDARALALEARRYLEAFDDTYEEVLSVIREGAVERDAQAPGV